MTVCTILFWTIKLSNIFWIDNKEMLYRFSAPNFQFPLNELVALKMHSCRMLFPKLCKISLLCLKLWLTKHTNQLKSYINWEHFRRCAWTGSFSIFEKNRSWWCSSCSANPLVLWKFPFSSITYFELYELTGVSETSSQIVEPTLIWALMTFSHLNVM